MLRVKRLNVALVAFVVSVLVFAPMVASVQAAGETLTTNKSNAKANIQIRFEAAGLTASTYYTLYVESTLKANKSTSSTETTLDFKITIADTYVGQYVTVGLRDVTGVTVLATYEIEVVDVVPQSTIDMLGGLIPLLMVFGVIMSAVFGIPQAIARKIMDLG